MSTLEEFDFSKAEAGAALSFPLEAGQIKKNSHICIKGRPCKVIDVSTSKTGKHGHAKARIVALDVFNGRKYEDICPSTHTVQVPNITRIDWTLLDITEDGFAVLMNDDGETKEDLQVPEGEVGDSIREAFGEGKGLFCNVVSAMGEQKILGFKEDNQ